MDVTYVPLPIIVPTGTDNAVRISATDDGGAVITLRTPRETTTYVSAPYLRKRQDYDVRQIVLSADDVERLARWFTDATF